MSTRTKAPSPCAVAATRATLARQSSGSSRMPICEGLRLTLPSRPLGRQRLERRHVPTGRRFGLRRRCDRLTEHIHGRPHGRLRAAARQTARASSSVSPATKRATIRRVIGRRVASRPRAPTSRRPDERHPQEVRWQLAQPGGDAVESASHAAYRRQARGPSESLMALVGPGWPGQPRPAQPDPGAIVSACRSSSCPICPAT